MLTYRNILFFVGILLFLESGMAIASDDNPWAMDEPSDSRQPYFDLGTGKGGTFGQSERFGGQSERLGGQSERFSGQGQGQNQGLARVPPQAPGKKNGRMNESIIPKSSASNGHGGDAGGSLKGDRGQFFGYAGPQPKGAKNEFQNSGRSQFGSFPPVSGWTEGKKRPAMTGKPEGSVQFGGKSFGAFAPKETGPVDAVQQQWQAFQEIRARRQRQKLSAFANRAPPPIPEPAPQSGYPYSGYGYGTGLAPRYGVPYGPGGYGSGGLGTGYGPTIVDPGLLGPTGPGFIW